MLIFNLLFVFGIENSNKNLNDSNINNDISINKIITQDTVATPNPTCTAIAVLLHYFLLVTFTWSGLSAAQLYFLLIRTMKPLPQHFILFISLIGWGKCLLLPLFRNLILLKSFNLNKHLLKEGLMIGGLEVREMEKSRNEKEYLLPINSHSCEGGRWIKAALVDIS